MIRDNSHLNANILDKIDIFNKSTEIFCDEVAINMDIIKNAIEFPHERQAIALFAVNIQVSSPGLASEISHYVNKYFFDVKELVKNIFTFVANPVETSSYKSPTGLKVVGCVSKDFYTITQLVKNE